MTKVGSARITRTAPKRPPKRACGLCGKTTGLTRTDCCDRWICDDEHEYVLFSYARNSCSRNHRRFTLCGYHSAEQHDGKWTECTACRESLETEIYVWYGTNEYNFEKLQNPPSFVPKFCAGCHRRLHLGTDGYLISGTEYWCEECGHRRVRIGSRRKARRGRDA